MCGLASRRSSLLSLGDLDQLELELRSNIYLTTSAVVCYVEKVFRVNYSISGMTKLLKRLGFSYKKPQAVPGKANAEAQEAFLSMLTELKESKGKEDAILYVDGVHPQHNVSFR